MRDGWRCSDSHSKTEGRLCSDFSGCWTELWWNRGERRPESTSMSGNDLCPASAQPVQATIIKTLNKGMPGTCQPASQPATETTNQRKPDLKFRWNIPDIREFWKLWKSSIPNGQILTKFNILINNGVWRYPNLPCFFLVSTSSWRLWVGSEDCWYFTCFQIKIVTGFLKLEV